ncbi:MAG: hypothetical protein ACOCSL_02755 [Thermoplasmatota archaeon]
MNPVHKKTVLIGIIFGVISVVILSYLKVQGAFLIIILWMLVPVFIKKILDGLKSVRK